MDVRALVVTAVMLLAGCAGAPPPAATLTPPTGAPLEPVSLDAPTFFPEINLGWNGGNGEPSIVVAPDGTVYVAAAPQLWRSDDGRTFESFGEPDCAGVDDVCLPGHGLRMAPLDGFGGGDADLGVDANGTVYFLGLNGASGTVPFQRSLDRGETWSEPFDVAEGNASDRQWLDVLPDGTVYATWRDRPGDDDAQFLFRRSADGGATWDPIRVIGPDTDIQGPLAHDPTTRAIYTPTYDGGIRVARSLDEGVTWTFHDVTREERDTTLREGRPIDMFPAIAVDAAGAIYVAWAADAPGDGPAGSKDVTFSRVWLAVSVDGGETWREPRAVSPEGKVATFPSLVAGAPGRIAINWYEGRLGTPSHSAPDVWDVAIVESGDASAPEPTFVGGYANQDPVHVGGICRSGGGCRNVCDAPFYCVGQDRSRSELFEIALREGHPITAWVADAIPRELGIEIHVGGVESGTPLS